MNKKIFSLLSITIIISGIVLRLLWAYFTPSWQSPDEYPHFYVIKQLSLTNKYPISKPYFPFYESFQPPLYYFLSAYLVYSQVRNLDNSSDDIENVLNEREKNYALILLRLFSTFISTVSLILMYKLLCVYFKDDLFSIILSLSFFCFLPTFVNNGATVNNDSLANLAGVLILFIIIKEPISYKKIFLLSVTCGAGIMTKSNILPFLFLIPLILFTESGEKKQKILYIFLFFLITGIICSFYIFWSYSRYGTFLPINPGLNRISPIVNITIPGVLRIIRNFNWSFWAAAGRIYEIHFHPSVYLFLYLPFLLISFLGIIKIFWRTTRNSQIGNIFSNNKNRLRIILLLSIIVETAASFYYTLGYPNFCSWGKYVYPILPSIAILFTEGMLNVFKRNITYTIAILFVISLIFSNLWLFFKIIV